MAEKRFVLLDRDGTINVEKHYLSDPGQLELLPNAAEGLRRLEALGLGLAVVTNQSGVARGYFDLQRVEEINGRLAEMLAEEGVHIAGFFVCPHGPEDPCDCRKPLPGLGLQAAKALGFDPRRAFLIGDKKADIGLGKAIGAVTLLVRTGYGREVEAEGGGGADHIVADLAEAARLIKGLL